MPLFFIISGALFNEKKHQCFLPFLIRRVRSLALPYLIFTMVAIAINSLSEDVSVINIILNGWGGYALWFLPVLFMAELLFYPSVHFTVGRTKKHSYLLSIILVLLLFGYLLSYWGIHLPYKVEVVPWATFFYGAGYLLKDVFRTIKSNWCICILLLLVTIVISQVLPRLDMCANIQGSVLFNNANAIYGTIVIILISKKIEITRLVKPLKKFFRWAGANTMLIVGLSQCVILGIKEIPLFHLMNIEAMNSVMRHAVLWVILYALSLAVNRYMPWVVGRVR